MAGASDIRRALSAFLAKSGGEGARGGQVLGHTSSGRPIYARRASGHASYAGFSAADHFETARAHLGRVGILNHRARNNPSRLPQSAAEKSMATRADRHMAHFRGHMRRARQLNATLPAHQRLEALA